MKKFLKIFTVILLVIGFSSCDKNNNTTRYIRYVTKIETKLGKKVEVLNTSVSLTIYRDKQRTRAKIFEIFEEEIHHAHRLFDRHNLYETNGKTVNNLKVINDSYGTDEEIVIHKDLYDLLSLSIEMGELTGGSFNPLLGELLDLWLYDENGSERYDKYASTKEDPNVEDINNELACVVPSNQLKDVLVLNDENSSVTFKKYNECEKVTISLGAIAKGYALDMAKAKLMKKYSNVPMILDAGSSSIMTIGINPTKPSENRPEKYSGMWLVGMLSANRSPNDLEAVNYVVATLGFEGEKVFSTSGDYERFYYNPSGIKRTHIINPKTGHSENYWRALSIFGDAPGGILDALSTALYNLETTEEIMGMLNLIKDYYEIDVGVFLETGEDKVGAKVTLLASNYFNEFILKETIKESLVTSIEVELID